VRAAGSVAVPLLITVFTLWEFKSPSPITGEVNMVWISCGGAFLSLLSFQSFSIPFTICPADGSILPMGNDFRDK